MLSGILVLATPVSASPVFYYNIGGILSDNKSDVHFNETLQVGKAKLFSHYSIIIFTRIIAKWGVLGHERCI